MVGGDPMEKVGTSVRGTGTRVFDKRFLSLVRFLPETFVFRAEHGTNGDSVVVTRLGNLCIRFICMRSTYMTHD